MDLSDVTAILPGPVVPASDRSEAAADSRNAATADFDSFLTLLTAQLRNQDPMAPLDSTQFIDQLASFSTVEQAIGTNDRLDTFIEQSFSGDLATFASWIGRDVVAEDGAFISNGAPVSFPVSPNAEADRVEAMINTTDGILLKQIPLDINAATGSWNGETASGNPATGSEVVITLNYFAGGAVIEEAPVQVPRTVSGLRGTADGLSLELSDGGEISPDKVTRLILATDTEN